MQSQIGKAQNHSEKCNPKSGKHKIEWKCAIRNSESIKSSGNVHYASQKVFSQMVNPAIGPLFRPISSKFL